MTPVHALPVLSWKVYHITNFLKGGGYTIASCACDRQLYSQFSVKKYFYLIIVLGKDYYIASCPGIDNYRARYPLTCYHITNFLGEKVTI